MIFSAISFPSKLKTARMNNCFNLLVRCFCLMLLNTLLAAYVVQVYSGSIRGKIVPHNAALNVWAVSNADTGRGVVQNGEFEIKNLRSGKYNVIVDARLPYKVTTKPDVMVNDSSNTDVGEIRLIQY